MKKLIIPSFILLNLGFAMQSIAQIQSRGEVQDQEFVIRKDRVLTLPTQPRIFEKLPVLPQPKGFSDFNYQVNFYDLNLPPVNLEATPVQKVYRPERMDIYPGFLKAGYGNFASPLIEARLMSSEIYDLNYSVYLKHQSFGKGPILAEQSKESHSSAGGAVSYFLDQVEVFGGLKWAQDSYSFYGIDTSVVNDPNLEFLGIEGNVLNTISFEAGLRDVEKTGPVSYEAKLNFRNFKDSYLVVENELGVQGTGTFRPAENWKGTVGLSYFMTTPEDEDYDLNRTYLGIRPKVSYQYEDFLISAGINIISENNSIPGKSSDFRIFPNLSLSYQFAEEFGFFGEFSGNVDRTTYRRFVLENPFLGPSSTLLNTINNYKIAGGIEGQVQGIVNYKAGIDVSRYNNFHLFVNSPSDSTRFTLIYDDQVNVVNINAELGLQLTDQYQLNSRLDLYSYAMNMQAEAWHRPTWVLGINNQITPLDQLLVQANINVMGGIKARRATLPTTEVFQTVNLKTIADLQLKADYKITDKFGVFAEGNNLLNGRNERWLNYPVRGVQLIGGAWLKF